MVLLERLPARSLTGPAGIVGPWQATLEAAQAPGAASADVDFGPGSARPGHGAAALPREATIFTCARIVGLVAHALEEYPHRLRFRPRATYVGPAPDHAGGRAIGSPRQRDQEQMDVNVSSRFDVAGFGTSSPAVPAGSGSPTARCSRRTARGSR